MNKIDFKNLPDTTTPLSAENLNLLQDNVENAIPTLDSAVSTSSTNGVENQAITNYVNEKTKVEQVNPNDYITISNSFTLASGSPIAYKVGNLVFYNFDITVGTFNNGETQIGTCTNKLAITSYGSGRCVASYPSTDLCSASLIAIPNGAFRIYTTKSGTRGGGTIILLVND